MIKLRAKTEMCRRSAEALIESDRRYFELGAKIDKLPLGELAWMPGLTDLAASCVVHRIDLSGDRQPSDRWLDQIEYVLRERAVARARIYLDECPSSVQALMRRCGYGHRCELGFLAPAGHPELPRNIRLCRVRTEADWRLKQSLHAEAMEGPDGYTNQADLWVKMERQKSNTGQMHCFLVRHDDQVVATVGAIVSEELVRLKNIVVAPRARRCGIGVATVWLLWKMAEAEYGSRLGVFGVEGGAGDRLYRRAGLLEITCQHEWSRLIAGERR